MSVHLDRRPAAAGRRSGGLQVCFAATVGRVVTVAAIWGLFYLVVGEHRWTRRIETGFDVIGLAAGRNLFVVALLFLFGSALRRRLRFALWTTFAVELLTVLVTLVALVSAVETPDLLVELERDEVVLGVVALAVAVIVSVFLFLSRRQFPARLRNGSVRASLIVLVGGLLGSIALGLAFAAAFPHGLDGIGERVAWALDAALGFQISALPDPVGGTGWAHALVSLCSLAVLLASIAVFLRSAHAKELMSAEDELELRGLLAEHGERDSLSYFATRRDKSVIFSPDRRAAVTYRTIGTVSLASADPIGDPGSWRSAVTAWLTDAREHAWLPAVLSASEAGARVYKDAGLIPIELGDEAIVDVDGFRFEDRTFRPLRQAIRRVREAGYEIEVCRHADLSADLLAECEELAERWRGNDTERGFSMALGRHGDPIDGRSVMVLARDADGRIRGLQSYVPWGRRGLSLDLMRRDRDAPNGLTEALVCAVIGEAPELGVGRVSLNFAVFRSVFAEAEGVSAGPIVRLVDGVLGFASRFWQIESLYRANAKYAPMWVPRYLCIDSSLSLTRTAIAAASAEGFLPGRRPPERAGGSDEVVAVAGGERLSLLEAAARQERALLSPPLPEHVRTRQQRDRIAKLERLRQAGVDPYPPSVERNATIAEVCARHQPLGSDERSGEQVSVCGRVRAIRDHGGLIFAVLEEGWATVQAMLDASVAGRDALDLWGRTVDVGDLVSVSGEVMTSRTGELSLLASRWAMAAKCLRPLPGVHAGFRDPEARIRDRALDMIVNRDTTDLLRARSRAVTAVRDGFSSRGYLEVETPMLQTVHGGAAARPFTTRINAYNMALSLRIAPELYLKRLAVGGFDAIFELNRNFRNEGADATHNPEFTAVEAYRAHGDYTTMRELTRELIIEVATAVHGEPVAVRPGPGGEPVRHRIDHEWPVVPIHRAVSDALGTEVSTATSESELRALCAEHGVHAATHASAGDLVLELYEALVEKQTELPVFYSDFPLEASPLTRTHREDPLLAERWDLVAWGMEIGTAYTELVDPVDQRRRLTEQSAKAAAGDPEAMQVDEAFLSALEYAMPPTGGLGIGVDRLVMLLTGSNIRGTLAFPFVRER